MRGTSGACAGTECRSKGGGQEDAEDQQQCWYKQNKLKPSPPRYVLGPVAKPRRHMVRRLDYAGMATAVCAMLAIGLLYNIIRRSPRRWWLFVWAIAVPLLVLLVFIQPVVDSLFETYEPLSVSHPDLVDSIEALLGRAGIKYPSPAYLPAESKRQIDGSGCFVRGFRAHQAHSWYGHEDAEEAGDDGHKCAHVIALDDGNFAAQPNNRIQWFCPAFVTPFKEKPDYLTNTRVWKVERETET